MGKTLSKAQALEILKSGGKVYLDDPDTHLKAIGLEKNIFVDQTGWNFTFWFYHYADDNGWYKLEEDALESL